MLALILGTRQRRMQQAQTRQALLIFIDHLLATHPVCTDTARLIFGVATATDIGSFFFAEVWQGPNMVGELNAVIPVEPTEPEEETAAVQ